ncbi:hypothetical protein LOAG_14223 [Loa loa]|uniref:Uncharacterized protein n=1 Tax=Loa loa TaxID=7209 RepID=A0A1S0TI60_LOALO|nr:hypothetical protein LOAG_14223 [Loa loa]EFO14299.2 hypothetical protein LOAG_14223 [Loa loa]
MEVPVMKNNLTKELVLFTLYATISPTFGLNCEAWTEDDYPPFIPEAEEAREEYCGLVDNPELSRNELNDMIKKWGAKYGVLVSIG